MIVELVGLPGAGKSTLARALAEDGTWKIVKTKGPLDIIWYNLLFLLRHPYWFSRGLFHLVRHLGKPSLWYMKFVNLFLVHNAKYMKASCLPFAIIDQGHHQNAISLFDTMQDEERIVAYLATLPRPDLLLCVTGDEETRMRHLRERGYGVREDLDPSQREEWEEASVRHFMYLFSHRGELAVPTDVVTDALDTKRVRALKHPRMWRFVMHLRMPTEKAHGLQIANTMDALCGTGAYAELWVPKRKNPIESDVATYYGLAHGFPVRFFALPDLLRLTPLLGSLAFFLDALVFLVALLCERVDGSVIHVTRSPEVAWLLRKKGAFVIFEAHAWPDSKRSLFRYFLSEANGVVANSDGTRARLEKEGVANVRTIRNGVDLEKFDIDMAAYDARRSLELPHEGKIILYVGSFQRWKGVPTLCAAWSSIRTQHGDAHLVLVGGTVADLGRFPEANGIDEDDRVTVRAHVRSREIPTYLRAADVLVLPNEPVSEESIRYTSPIKSFEYMASGRPIVVSDLPSLREVLHEDNAMFFPAGDAHALSTAIERLLLDRATGEKKARQARADVQEFGWDARARKLDAFASELIDTH